MNYNSSIHSFMHSFIASNCSILVRVVVNPELILETLVGRWDNSSWMWFQSITGNHLHTPSHNYLHIHLHMHKFKGNFSTANPSTCMSTFDGGKTQRAWKNPMYTQWEHTVTQAWDQVQDPWSVRQQCYWYSHLDSYPVHWRVINYTSLLLHFTYA